MIGAGVRNMPEPMMRLNRDRFHQTQVAFHLGVFAEGLG
jgi:hypothetical protein